MKRKIILSLAAAAFIAVAMIAMCDLDPMLKACIVAPTFMMGTGLMVDTLTAPLVKPCPRTLCSLSARIRRAFRREFQLMNSICDTFNNNEEKF